VFRKTSNNIFNDAAAKVLASNVPSNINIHYIGNDKMLLSYEKILNYSKTVVEMRDRQERKRNLSMVAPSQPSCLRPIELPLPLNILEQSVMTFQHHGIYACVMSKQFPFKKDFVLDVAGLYVPVEFDCRNLAENAQVWGSYDFFTPIPDRWTRCLDHQLLLQGAGLKEGDLYRPLLPVIDEEYPERAMIYQMVLAADRNKQKEFVFVDLGARWGTWSSRAIAALRSYNPMPYKVYMVETNEVHCQGAKRVIEVNKFENVELYCDLFNHEHFLEFASTVDQIDVIDLDCDGCEKLVMPLLRNLLAKKVKRVILACHWNLCNDNTSPWFQSVFPSNTWRVVDSSDQENGCISHLRAGDFDKAAACRYPFQNRPTLGKIINGDGVIVVDNIVLMPPNGFPFEQMTYV